MKLEIRIIPPTGDPIELTYEEAKEMYLTLKEIFDKKA